MAEFIVSLEAKNYGPFENLKVDFNPDVNIIIGTNGTGKTSILKLICYCTFSSGLQFMRARAGAQVSLKAHLGYQDFTWIGANSIEVTNQNARFPHIGVYARADPGLNNPHVIAYPGTLTAKKLKLLAIGAVRQVIYSNIDGMKREMAKDYAHEDYLRNNIEALENSFMPNIKQWMINRYFIIEKDWAKIEGLNWHTIIEALPHLSPDGSSIAFARIEKDLEPVFLVNGRECYLEELSSGFKSFLSILFSITQWCEAVNDGDDALIQEAFGTVIIDEIDAHLHPKWQSTILKSLKSIFPYIQFIVTSHSPLVIANAEPLQVIRIPEFASNLELRAENKTYKGWQLEYILEDIMLTNISSGLSDEILVAIDKAYTDKSLNEYDMELSKLEVVLSPKDPIIQYYKIKRSNLLLDDTTK